MGTLPHLQLLLRSMQFARIPDQSSGKPVLEAKQLEECDNHQESGSNALMGFPLLILAGSGKSLRN